MPETSPSPHAPGALRPPHPPEHGAAARRPSPPQPVSRPVWTLLALVLLLGAAIRTWNLRDLPAGLFCDEAALGYNAWAVLHHGIDENGATMPLFVWSFSGYKNPVFLYASMLPIGLLGLSETSVRLTSALFGTGTIAALFFLGLRLVGPRTGLVAAFLLAICPWHLHFSRIAFEVISFPLLFTLGLIQLLRFVDGERRLPHAFFLMGTCFYAYAVSKLFVPLFLAAFALLYLDTIRRRLREWAVATAVLLATALPQLVFDLVHHERGGAYFRNASIFQPGRTLPEVAAIFLRNYQSFFGRRFLFEQGDPIARHAVRESGELLPFFLPLLVLGAASLLLFPDRRSKLPLIWLALYPAGASLMNEIPSATRGFIGPAAFCLIAGAGAGAVLRALEVLSGVSTVGQPPRPIARYACRTLQAAGIATLLFFAVRQSSRYLDHYVNDYTSYAAAGIGGFQYGYRQLVEEMEPQRPRYPLMLWTATNVNQPYVFSLFYRRLPPGDYVKSESDPGYFVLWPGEYRRYELDRPVLYAVRPEDLTYFSDYTIRKDIVAPGGQLEFHVAEVRRRKAFIGDWMALGPFDDPDDAAGGREHPHGLAGTPEHGVVGRRAYAGRSGPTIWRTFQAPFVDVDLGRYFGTDEKGAPTDTSGACGYLFTTLTVPASRLASVEIVGPQSSCGVFLNGRRVPCPPDREEETARVPVDLRAGENLLLVKSCAPEAGPWEIRTRVTDPEGNDLTDLTARASLPEEPLPPVSPPLETLDVTVLEGFDGIGTFRRSGPHPDYRGESMSWWAYREDEKAEISWRTAPAERSEVTTVVFTGSVSEAEGTAELWVNDQYALTFELGFRLDGKTYRRGPWRLTFEGRERRQGNSGVFLLTVPAHVVVPGRPLEIRVLPAGESGNAWFMIKERRDTAAYEEVEPDWLRTRGRR